MEASIGIGILSLLGGLLNTINSYFSYGRVAESHKNSYINYAKMYRFIKIEMSLPREERMRCRDLIRLIQEQYERLQELSQPIPNDIIADFKKKFRNNTISKPEIANGLDKISIYGRDTQIDNEIITPQTIIEVERNNSHIDIEVESEE